LFNDKTKQERVFDSIVEKKRGREEDIEKSSVDLLKIYDLKNR
jgi:hypothetical protein